VAESPGQGKTDLRPMVEQKIGAQTLLIWEMQAEIDRRDARITQLEQRIAELDGRAPTETSP
jgi:hypothetical protein